MKNKIMLSVFLVLLVNSMAFAVATPPPVIRSFSPLSGAAGTVVTIVGNNLDGTTAVNIGGVRASNVRVQNSNTVVATVGASSDTTFIDLVTPGGSATTRNSNLGIIGDGRFESFCNPIIDIERSLAINDPAVLSHQNTKGPTGPWSFNFLMSQMAPTGMSTSVFIKKWLMNWKRTTVVNGNPISGISTSPKGVVPAAPASDNIVLVNWPRTKNAAEFDGTPPLDLTKDQFELVAITFRPDLDNTSTTASAGEGRFVFHAISTGFDEIILEFKLPKNMGTSPTSVGQWNMLIHDLSSVLVGSPGYILKLQSVTDLFSKKTFSGVPGMTNGSAINQVRTNAIEMEGGSWSLREFKLTPTRISAASGVVAADAGELVTHTTHDNPAEVFDVGGSDVEKWAVKNKDKIINGTVTFDTKTLGGLALSQRASGWVFTDAQITDSVKKAFDMRTCMGCHGPAVNLNFNSGSGNPFLQSSKRGFSTFMTGGTDGKVVGPKVLSTDRMPGGFNAPFSFNIDRSGNFTANIGYSDLHFRAHNLLTKIIANSCK